MEWASFDVYLEIIVGVYQLFCVVRTQKRCHKNRNTVCACLCEVNKEVFSECMLQSVCHRDPVSLGDKHSCFIQESKTVNAALAGLGHAGCLEVGRCNSVDALVAEQSKQYVVPFTLRQSEPRSVTFTGSTAHCGEASHKVHLSGILHQLRIICLTNERNDNLMLFSAVQVRFLKVIIPNHQWAVGWGFFFLVHLWLPVSECHVYI